MHWTQLKYALVYGHPPLNGNPMSPETIRLAVREITRLLRVGWLDTLTPDARIRIQQVCELGDCVVNDC